MCDQFHTIITIYRQLNRFIQNKINWQHIVKMQTEIIYKLLFNADDFSEIAVMTAFTLYVFISKRYSLVSKYKSDNWMALFSLFIVRLHYYACQKWTIDYLLNAQCAFYVHDVYIVCIIFGGTQNGIIKQERSIYDKWIYWCEGPKSLKSINIFCHMNHFKMDRFKVTVLIVQLTNGSLFIHYFQF